MNPQKCAFEVSARKFLGFLVHNRGIDVNLAKTTVRASMRLSCTVKELKSFLGKVSYFRMFILGLMSITSAFAKLFKRVIDLNRVASS